MTDIRSTRMIELFDRAIEMEPTEREGFLREELEDDEAAIEELNRLIRRHEAAAAAGFMEVPPVPAPADFSPELSADFADSRSVLQPRREAGERIGPYRILSVLGEGGMGVVYLAEQDHPLHRLVAIKIVKLGMDTREILARFRREQQALARMDHPGIARVLSSGETNDPFGRGRPYFVMDYVPGEAIATFCDSKRLNTAQRLRLIEQVCDALQHAHANGILHRDIKPSNILVVQQESAGPAAQFESPAHCPPLSIKIIDFGIACALQEDDRQRLTRQGQILGTPEFMSPERLQPDLTDEVGPPIDVFSLGMVMYEMFAGALPMNPIDASHGRSEFEATLRAARRHGWPAPDQRYGKLPSESREAIAQNRSTHQHALKRMLRGDVGRIIMKAIAPAPGDRYSSIAELAADIARLRRNEPVHAGRDAMVARLVRLSHRHRLALAAVAMLLLIVTAILAIWRTGETGATVLGGGMLVVGAGFALWGAWRSRQMAQEVAEYRDRAERARTEAQLVRTEAERQREEGQQRAYVGSLIAAEEAMRDHAYAIARRHLAEAPEPLRRWEWFYLLSQLEDRSDLVLRGHEDWIVGIALSPDGTTIASSSRDQTIRLWCAETGHIRATLRGHQDLVHSVCFHPDGKQLASGSWDRTVRIWDVRTGKAMATLRGHRGWIAPVTYSPDGRFLASGSSDGTVMLWRTSGTDAERDSGVSAAYSNFCAHSSVIYALAFNPAQLESRFMLATGSADASIRLWHVGEGGSHRLIRTLSGHRDWVRGLAFSPDGSSLASAGADREIRLWSVRDGRCTGVLRGHDDRVYTVAFLNSGQRLASGSSDATVRIWDIQSERAINILHGHEARVFALGVTPGGGQIVTGSEDATVRKWTVRGDTTRSELQVDEGPVFAVVFSPDGRTLASASGDKTIDLWQARTEQRPASSAVAAASDADQHLGKEVRSSDDDTACIRVWDYRSGRPMASLHGHAVKISSLSFSPDGRFLASAAYDGTVRLWEMKNLDETSFTSQESCDFCRSAPSALQPQCRIFKGHAGWVLSVAFSPDGSMIASGGGDRTTRLWDVKTGRELCTMRGHYDRVNAVAFSPDGSTLASGSSDGTVRIWDVASCSELTVLRGHRGFVFSLAWGPGGTACAGRIATGSSDNSIRIWDVATGITLATLRGHATWVFSLAFSPDGMRLVSASWDKTVRIWDPTTAVELLALRGHDDRVNAAAFSPDGTTIASGSWDRTVRLWTRTPSPAI